MPNTWCINLLTGVAAGSIVFNLLLLIVVHRLRKPIRQLRSLSNAVDNYRRDWLLGTGGQLDALDSANCLPAEDRVVFAAVTIMIKGVTQRLALKAMAAPLTKLLLGELRSWDLSPAQQRILDFFLLLFGESFGSNGNPEPVLRVICSEAGWICSKAKGTEKVDPQELSRAWTEGVQPPAVAVEPARRGRPMADGDAIVASFGG